MSMASNPPPPVTPPPAPACHRPPWLTSLLLVLVPAAVIVAGAWATAAWLTGTATGLRAVLWAASWTVPSLQATGVYGSLRGGLTLERLVLDEPRWSVDLEQFSVTPEHIGWSERTLDLAAVAARTAAVRWTPGESKAPPEPPASLALPLLVRLRSLAIGELRLGERGRDPQVVRDIRLQGEADRESIRIARAGARYGTTEV